ncbi:uncharacterized protein [Pyrus communis]|uniref:uncharacterized protein n=1 Tax=Pyrus communis TaxID=23211 RepID=UPI0035C12E3C
MSSKQGGIAKPLEAPEAEKKEHDESDLANLQKKKDEEKALKAGEGLGMKVATVGRREEKPWVVELERV